jgi:hypothetical protein
MTETRTYPQARADSAAWVSTQTDVVLSYNRDEVTAVGLDGSMRHIPDKNQPALEALLEVLQANAVDVWADAATETYNALRRLAVTRLRGLKSVQVAELTLWPALGKKIKTMPVLTIEETIEKVKKIKTELDHKPDLRRWFKLDQDTDAMWREPSAHGYLVDKDVLAQHQRAADAERATSLAYFGRDLLNDDEALKWMREQGIVCLDSKGVATCSHREFASAEVPEELLGADWPMFVAIRTAASIAHSLTGVYSNIHKDGRTHPRINAVGTVTGRMSITEPAMQATPRVARDIYKSNDGYMLVGCDLSQVEPTLTAALSEDPGLLAAVKKGIYEELAVSVWGESARGNSQLRNQAKTALNATNYGQGAKSMARRLDCTVEEAQKIIWAWNKNFPTFASWKRDLIASSERGEQLTTFGGRPLPLLEKHYQATAYVVQGSAADVFKLMVRKVAQRIRATDSRAQLWLPLHDELVLSVPDTDDEVELACAILADCMTVEINGVTVSGKPEVLGRSWRKL